MLTQNIVDEYHSCRTASDASTRCCKAYCSWVQLAEDNHQIICYEDTLQKSYGGYDKYVGTSPMLLSIWASCVEIPSKTLSMSLWSLVVMSLMERLQWRCVSYEHHLKYLAITWLFKMKGSFIKIWKETSKSIASKFSCKCMQQPKRPYFLLTYLTMTLNGYTVEPR
jgi:hypothetical protein